MSSISEIQDGWRNAVKQDDQSAKAEWYNEALAVAEPEARAIAVADGSDYEQELTKQMVELLPGLGPDDAADAVLIWDGLRPDAAVAP